jgi:integrase/recombinase XerD
MSLIAPTLQAFFTARLTQQRNASPHTVIAYRRSFCLLLAFIHERSGKEPSRLDFTDLSASAVAAFLQHLETERANSIRCRNARLAAIHSFFRFAATRHPEHAEDIQRVLAIPHKRSQRVDITHLDHREIVSLLAAPDRSTWHGRRDYALLLVIIQTGLRLTELTALKVLDVHLGGGAHVRCRGKGRKDRCTPLNNQTVVVLKNWLRENGGMSGDPLFSTRRGNSLSPDAVESLVAEHARTAARKLSISSRQAGHSSRSPAHHRHAVASRRGGYRNHRAVARARTRADYRHLPPRGHVAEGEGVSQAHAFVGEARTVSGAGRTDALLGWSMIIPKPDARATSITP